MPFTIFAIAVHKAYSYGLDGADCSLYFNHINNNAQCNSDTTETISGFNTGSIGPCLNACNGAVPANKYLIACSHTGGGCAVTYGDSRKDCTSFFSFSGRSYTNCGPPPPTPSPTLFPTLSPTPSPTFECTESIHCGANEYCTTSNTCDQTACTVSNDCDGLFKAGRIRHCGTGGFCEDLYPGTCSTDAHCASEIKKYRASNNGVSKVTRTIASDDPVVKVNATKQLLQRLNAQKNENYTTVATVKSEESGSIPQSVIDQAGGESAFITGIKNSMFDSDLHDAVTVQVGGSRRVLQESTSVEISITYEIDDDAYDLITENGTLSSGNFVNNLAAELGIGAGNITVNAVDGNLVIDIVLLESEEVDGVPLGDEIITEIQNIDSLLTSITSDLVSEIDGLDANDVESSAIDYCGDRTCNGRGDNTESNTNSVGCNINTGVCVCQEGYWGINCGTACNCLNERECVGGLCKCYYPEWGLRCENDKDCESCVA